MKKGGQQRQITLRSLHVLRLGELLVAGSFFVYCILAANGLVFIEPRFSSGFVSCVIAAFWLLMTIIEFFLPLPSRREGIAKYFIHLFFIILLTLSYTTFLAPTTYLFAVSIIAAYIYLDMRGLYMSVGILALIALIDAIVTQAYIEAFTISTITAITGGIIAASMRGRSVDQAEVDSSKKQAIIQHDRTITLINNLADAVVSTDADGYITAHNAAVLNLLDTNADLDDQMIDTVLTLEDTEHHKQSMLALLQAATNVTVRDDLLAVVSGEPLRIEVTYAPIRSTYSTTGDKQFKGYVIILRDITSAKSLEEERDEFISVVSHELRTPITIAEGTISNVQLMMDRSDVPKEKLQEAVDMAHDQVVFLARMVNDLSTLSRAERGVADTAEAIDVDELIHGLYSEYHPHAEEKGLRLDLHMPGRIGHVLASRLYLKELLQNFITNAIKYTKQGSITITVSKTREGLITMAVKDTGIGISKADQKRIFDKFFRAEDYRTRETNGTGLGLYVAVKLARKLGTDISLQSRLNHGSTFSISLPEHKEPKTTHADTSAAKPKA